MPRENPSIAASALLAFACVVECAALAHDAAKLPPQAQVVEAEARVQSELRRLAAFTDRDAAEFVVDLADRILRRDALGFVELDQRGIYVSASEWCQRQLASLPESLLARYRQRIDPSAAEIYRQAVAIRDAERLEQLVDTMFVSNWGDDALLALGELALESGKYTEARHCWRRISTVLPTGPGGVSSSDELLFVYPDTNLDAGAIAARLAVVSIRAGELERAEREIAWLRANHAGARGRLGGREVRLADRLGDLLAAELSPSDDRPPEPLPKFAKAWQFEFSPTSEKRAIAVADAVVLVTRGRSLLAFDRATGKATFGATPQVASVTALTGAKPHLNGFAIAGRYVFGTSTDLLWGIDLQRDAALVLRHQLESGQFVGKPVVAGGQVLAVHVSATGKRVSLASFDVGEQSLRWRQPVAQLTRAVDLSECTLVADAGIAYCDTGQGVIAAFRIRDGRPLWAVDSDGDRTPQLTLLLNERKSNVVVDRRYTFRQVDNAIELSDIRTGATISSAIPLPSAEPAVFAADGEFVFVLQPNQLSAWRGSAGAMPTASYEAN